MAVREKELEGLRVTVGAKSNFVELLKIRLEQEQNSFEKAKAAFETRLAEAETQPHEPLSEMIAHKDRLCDELDRLLSDQSVCSVEF